MRKIAIAGALGWGMMSLSAAQAAPLNSIGTTTPLEYRVSIDLFQGSTGYGDVTATGFEMDTGTMEFIAWCFDLEHEFITGQSYDYVETATPYTTSTLLAGAEGRAQSVFDANYGGVDAYDIVEAAGFQLALWEAAYDTDYDITTGLFQASGLGTYGAAIESAATSYLTSASGYAGSLLYNVAYLQDNSVNAGLYPDLADDHSFQNMVTATVAPPPAPGPAPIPLPAGAPLLAGAIGAVALLRRRGAKRPS